MDEDEIEVSKLLRLGNEMKKISPFSFALFAEFINSCPSTFRTFYIIEMKKLRQLGIKKE